MNGRSVILLFFFQNTISCALTFHEGKASTDEESRRFLHSELFQNTDIRWLETQDGTTELFVKDKPELLAAVNALSKHLKNDTSETTPQPDGYRCFVATKKQKKKLRQAKMNMLTIRKKLCERGSFSFIFVAPEAKQLLYRGDTLEDESIKLAFAYCTTVKRTTLASSIVFEPESSADTKVEQKEKVKK